ncbi:hypothetical protein, partial [Flavobacterium psychrophilum]|uniref:hypothetical protein n=1 Tax=Flavobacterium psychrophilum TaxID=96345 RepID=UPI001C9B9E67
PLWLFSPTTKARNRENARRRPFIIFLVYNYAQRFVATRGARVRDCWVSNLFVFCCGETTIPLNPCILCNCCCAIVLFI